MTRTDGPMVLKIVRPLRTALLVLTGVLAGGGILLGAAYLYLMHTRPPEAPRLSAPIQQGTVRVDTLERTYLAYVPANVPEHPALVLAFHGSKGDGQTMRVYTGYVFERLADQHGFIVVYPDGFENHWNDCRSNGPYAANVLDVDDLGFVRALIGRFEAEYGIDTAQVFATGFSNGGHMTFRLALEMPDAVRAVAAVSASLPTPDNLDCTPSGQPVSVMIMNGTDDPVNPFNGGEVSLHGFLKRGTVQSAEASAAYFSRLAGYDPTAASRPQTNDLAASNALERITWTDTARPEVSLYVVHGGGHTIPQPYFRFPRLLGPTHPAIDGPAEIWAFFERQTRATLGQTAAAPTNERPR